MSKPLQVRRDPTPKLHRERRLGDEANAERTIGDQHDNWRLCHIRTRLTVLCFRLQRDTGGKMAHATLAHRWFEEVWNQGRESTIDELVAEDFVTQGLTDPAGNQVKGPASFKPFFRQIREAFPDVHFAIEDTLLDGDRILARCRVTGTHTGAGITPTPTNKPINITGMCLIRVRDGKVVEAWNNFDFLSLYHQLGMQLC